MNEKNPLRRFTARIITLARSGRHSPFPGSWRKTGIVPKPLTIAPHTRMVSHRSNAYQPCWPAVCCTAWQLGPGRKGSSLLSRQGHSAAGTRVTTKLSLALLKPMSTLLEATRSGTQITFAVTTPLIISSLRTVIRSSLSRRAPESCLVRMRPGTLFVKRRVFARFP